MHTKTPLSTHEKPILFVPSMSQSKNQNLNLMGGSGGGDINARTIHNKRSRVIQVFFHSKG